MKWLLCSFSRQDSVMLLDNMTVVSKNPNYYTSELEAMTLAHLQTKAIPKDRIKLQEEIGEGAFGKVFRGRCSIVGELTIICR